MASFMAFDEAFTGGVFVTTLRLRPAAHPFIVPNVPPQVVVSADAGGGPHVKIFSMGSGQELSLTPGGSFMAYDEANCEYVKLSSKQIDDRLKAGPELVSANFVIPYPPGFPIMVPGQVITQDTITFMRKLDVKEIHGYQAAQGLKLLKPDVLAKQSNGPR